MLTGILVALILLGITMFIRFTKDSGGIVNFERALESYLYISLVFALSIGALYLHLNHPKEVIKESLKKGKADTTAVKGKADTTKTIKALSYDFKWHNPQASDTLAKSKLKSDSTLFNKSFNNIKVEVITWPAVDSINIKLAINDTIYKIKQVDTLKIHQVDTLIYTTVKTQNTKFYNDPWFYGFVASTLAIIINLTK